MTFNEVAFYGLGLLMILFVIYVEFAMRRMDELIARIRAVANEGEKDND